MIHTRKKYIQSPQIFQSTSLGRGRRLIRHTAIERFWISIHVPRVEDDVTAIDCQLKTSRFQSTSPGWRTTTHLVCDLGSPCYFNPRPPCGGRLKDNIRVQRGVIFQSTSPVWRTTERQYSRSTRSDISIHVPRVEDDICNFEWRFFTFEISIHVPRVEDDDFFCPSICRR